MQCTIDFVPASQVVPCLSLAIARLAVPEKGNCSGAGTGAGAGGVIADRGGSGDGHSRGGHGVGGRGKGGHGTVDEAIADVRTGTKEGPGSHEDGGHEDMQELHFDL